MALYDEFAYLYAKGSYPKYSQRMAELLPAALRGFDVHPRTVLDVACGEGTFALAMARQGLDVTGLDASPEMLKIARLKADKEGLRFSLVHGDMRSLPFREQFDLVSCWYDSLNYLHRIQELEETFRGVFKALRPGGIFIFDMNTTYGLAVMWQSHPFCVMQNTDGLFEVHINSYDFEKQIATKRVVGFVSRGAAWYQIDEVHQERGYSLIEISACLSASGLKEIACWGSLKDMTPPTPETPRVWMLARREA